MPAPVARANYLFPVRSMSKVFRAILLRRVEALDSSPGIRWPERLDTLEARCDWRLKLAGHHGSCEDGPFDKICAALSRL